MSTIILNGDSLTLEDFIAVARHGAKIDLPQDVKDNMQKSRDLVEKYVDEEKVVYGITTGFGKFSDVNISKEDTKRLQKNLIMSHACGVGEIFNVEESRGVMLLRVNALAKGYSGIRISTVQTLVDMLNKGVTPIIPQQGSLGSSGDLAPLAHMVLVMFGEGEAIYKGERMTGKDAMAKAGIP
ncbi:MAG: aromatic amino acid lyase, partial [Tissierellia bacterium]|nr:aromatic amino acid lyase [Tissierellia bacterium]